MQTRLMVRWIKSMTLVLCHGATGIDIFMHNFLFRQFEICNWDVAVVCLKAGLVSGLVPH
jgi:hypothetical protein